MKITLDRQKCIGCGSCSAVCPQFFEMIDDGKAHLVGLKKDDQKEALEVTDAVCAKEAVDVCPVQAISVEI